MLSVMMLSVMMLSAIMLSVIVLSAIMLSAILLSALLLSAILLSWNFQIALANDNLYNILACVNTPLLTSLISFMVCAHGTESAINTALECSTYPS